MMLITSIWYPLEVIHRYDFIFIAAILFQVALFLLRLETPREAVVIVVFHLVATVMELFKTSDAIGSWVYPENFIATGVVTGCAVYLDCREYRDLCQYLDISESIRRVEYGDARQVIVLVYADVAELRFDVTIQLTSDLPDSGVKSAHIHLYIARFFLVLEQIRGNLNSYG